MFSSPLGVEHLLSQGIELSRVEPEVDLATGDNFFARVGSTNRIKYPSGLNKLCALYVLSVCQSCPVIRRQINFLSFLSHWLQVLWVTHPHCSPQVPPISCIEDVGQVFWGFFNVRALFLLIWVDLPGNDLDWNLSIATPAQPKSFVWSSCSSDSGFFCFSDVDN